MRRRFGIAAAWAIVTVSCLKFAASETKPAEERNSALGVVRLVKAAENAYFQSNGRYATFLELINSKQLAQTATGSQEHLRAYFGLNLASESEPFPGFKLGLDVPENGDSYKLSLGPVGKCSFGFRTDEKDAVFEDKLSDCSGKASPELPPAWGPADIDPLPVLLHQDEPCPLSSILQSASHRARELEDSLQKFTARERIEHLEIGKNGKPRNNTSSMFDYVAEIVDVGGGAYINEYRNQVSDFTATHAPLADTGTAAFALLFLPHNMDEFVMTCEGRAELNTRPVWRLHFAQRTDRANDFRAYRINNRLYPVNIKGRAWVAADTFEVLRLESDLLAPLKEINLAKEHLVIEYGPVAFPKRHARLWLPNNVELYIEYRGHRYERRHQFSRFQLFSVDTVQETHGPDPDNDEIKKN
jgi:hypothetical protein